MGPVRRPMRPGVHLRVAVHGEDAADAVQHVAVDGVRRTAGQHLLGRLEDQPDRAGQQVTAGQLGQHQAGAENDGGVHVVPAGVRAVGDRRAVGDGLGVRNGQRVDVGAQRERVTGAAHLAADVADQSGAGGEHPRGEARLLQTLLDRGGGAELLVPELGVHVEVAPEGDELLVESVRECAGQCGQVGGDGHMGRGRGGPPVRGQELVHEASLVPTGLRLTMDLVNFSPQRDEEVSCTEVMSACGWVQLSALFEQ